MNLMRKSRWTSPVTSPEADGHGDAHPSRGFGIKLDYELNDFPGVVQNDALRHTARRS